MDPNQVLPGVTQQAVNAQTTALLRWGPIEWLLIMMLASFGVLLLFDTVGGALRRMSPPVAPGSTPQGGGRGSSGYLDDGL